jgi:hypothetical protein
MLCRSIFRPHVRLISFSPDEMGVVAVGQEAHGFIAFGQMARGFIAVGQLAFGVVAVGQLSASIVGVGQVGFGVAWFTGMLGLGGRGICLRLIPGLDHPRVPPEHMSFAQIAGDPQRDEGWARMQILVGSRGDVRLGENGVLVAGKMTPEVAGGLREAHVRGKLTEVYVKWKRRGRHWVASTLMEVPGNRPPEYALGFQIARFVVLTILAAVWWYLFSELVL